MKPLTLLVLAAFSIAASPATAGSWRVTGVSGEAPDRAVYLVDVDSIQRSGSKVNFNSMTIWELDDADMDSSRTARVADCSTRQHHIVRNSFYLAGKLTSEETEPTDSAIAAPDTMMGDVLDAVCGRLNYTTDASEDPEPLIRQWFMEEE